MLWRCELPVTYFAKYQRQTYVSLCGLEPDIFIIFSHSYFIYFLIYFSLSSPPEVMSVRDDVTQELLSTHIL